MSVKADITFIQKGMESGRDFGVDNIGWNVSET